jgi:hypothetical protein
VAGLIGAQFPLPQAARSIHRAHRAARAQIAPRFVALPPTCAVARMTNVFISRFAVGHAFNRFVAPHIGDAFGHVIAAVASLAPLEVEPFLVLKGAVARVRAVMNAGRLAVTIPLSTSSPPAFTCGMSPLPSPPMR